MENILILVPHPDDELISSGGYIIDKIKEGCNVFIHFFAVGGPSSNTSTKKRINEMSKVMSELSVFKYTYDTGLDGRLDTVPNCLLTKKIDSLMNEVRPDIAICTYKSHHADHNALYNAFLGSIRLKESHFVKTVALSEYPFIFTSYNQPEGGKVYHSMNEETFKKKCNLFRLYKSQVKKSPSPIGIEGLKVLAKTRGMESGNKYAECFYLLRSTI